MTEVKAYMFSSKINVIVLSYHSYLSRSYDLIKVWYKTKALPIN